jgi:hypothetical protein
MFPCNYRPGSMGSSAFQRMRSYHVPIMGLDSAISAFIDNSHSVVFSFGSPTIKTRLLYLRIRRLDTSMYGLIEGPFPVLPIALQLRSETGSLQTASRTTNFHKQRDGSALQCVVRITAIFRCLSFGPIHRFTVLEAIWHALNWLFLSVRCYAECNRSL